MGALVKMLAVSWLTAAAFGDASVAALITGSFAVVNTFLIIGLRRRQDELHRSHEHLREAVTADRRIIFDAAGDPIGTVLELKPGSGWDTWRLQAKRRHDDPPE